MTASFILQDLFFFYCRFYYFVVLISLRTPYILCRRVFFFPRNARCGAAFNLPCVELHMPCNSICLFYTKVMVGFVFYTKASPWTGLVIFPLAAPCCLRLPAAPIVLPVENGGFFRSVYTAGGRQDLQIGSTNTEHNFFFSLLTLTVITVEQSKSSRKHPSCRKTRHFPPFLPSASVCFPFKLYSDLMRLSRPSLHGLFIYFFMAQQYGSLQMLSSFISQPIRSLALCGETERPPGPYCIS